MSDDKDQRTEAPSPRRLQQARDDGQVAIGKDAASVAALSAGAIAVFAVSTLVRDALVTSVMDVARAAGTRGMPSAAVQVRPLLIGAIVPLAAAFAGAATTLLQTQWGIWGKLAAPDFKRVFSLQRLTRMFKLDFAVDFAMSIVKISVIFGIAWLCLRSTFATLPMLLRVPLPNMLGYLGEPLFRTAFFIVLAMAIVSVADYLVQRHRHLKKLRMSKEELKREHKEDEGDPQLKSKRKARARQMVQTQISKEVPMADFLLVNPTHIAIAIRYERGKDAAPKVTAKGKDHLAEVMRQLARENGVPIMQDIPLARFMYKTVKPGQDVPADTYRAIASMLAFVYRVTGKARRTP